MKAGTYYGKPIKAVTTESGNKLPMIVVTFSIDNMAIDGHWQAIEPVERNCRWSMADNAWSYTKQKLNDLGFNGDFDNPQFSLTDGVNLKCELREQDGRAREQWDLENWGKREYESARPDVIRKFNALWKAQAGELKKTVAPVQTEADPSPFIDEDGQPIF